VVWPDRFRPYVRPLSGARTGYLAKEEACTLHLAYPPVPIGAHNDQAGTRATVCTCNASRRAMPGQIEQKRAWFRMVASTNPCRRKLARDAI
jgi:hypothetical protein